ncbi:ECF transporter S component [Petroclostridium sp. X23]|uniref:ECF transporter S component n=1 Tax=Petroclostridium sp. X23 TaxID=3045146 RepID=UPI0024ADD56C|nr:ECF transporter S component [Petroclostridium sp. X23]WHH58915.1 ECF transporter S component [Petroclostridium sp. X23]
MMDNKKVEWLTRTAMLLAVTIVFQNLRVVVGVGPHSQFIIGSLVNAALLVSVGMLNLYAGLLISIVAPVVAFFQGQLPLPVLIPIVALGNAAIVAVYDLLKKKNQLAAVIAGAFAKFVFFVVAIQMSLQLFNVKIPAKIVATFSWPQLVTALIGGAVAVVVLKALKSALKSQSFGQ